jgi:hypothetical protein
MLQPHATERREAQLTVVGVVVRPDVSYLYLLWVR